MTLRPIQIWQPEDGCWVRPPPGPFGDHYAATEVLRPRPEHTAGRVVLVGESVAAGYLYAPAYTPAAVLSALLPGHDVVDLARTNESLETLAQTVAAAVQLDPDVVVMWAGNNWMLRDLAALSPYHPAASARPELAEVLATSGPGGAASFGTGEMQTLVTPLLERIAATVRGCDARLVVVVPEVNLHDWDHRQPVSWLPDGGVASWYDAWDRVGAEAPGAAAAMLAVDGGSTATAHHLSADALSGDDEVEAALRRAVDAAAGPLRATSSAPMATEAAQDVLRRWAAREGAAVVDVPRLIASRGDRADRRWFLDYCHHTALGIGAVVSEVAAAIGDRAPGPPLEPDPAITAAAALGALVHTAHRLASTRDRTEILSHWRDVAMGAWEGAEAMIADLVACRLAGDLAVLHPATARLATEPGRFGFAHGLRRVGVGPEVLAVLGVSETVAATASAGVERAWPTDELWEPAEHPWVDAIPHARDVAVAFHRSIWPTSRFLAVVAEPGPLTVTLTARTRGGPATIVVGGWQAPLSVDERWSTVTVEVPAGAVGAGVHPIHVHWSMPDETNRWSRALADLAGDRPPELHPVFGEVHSLRVDARPAS